MNALPWAYLFMLLMAVRQEIKNYCGKRAAVGALIAIPRHTGLRLWSCPAAIHQEVSPSDSMARGTNGGGGAVIDFLLRGVNMGVEGKFITMKVADLIPYENNPREIPQEAIEAVRESFRQCAPLDPIEVDENNVILSGHTRRLAALAEKITELKVIQWTGMTEEQKIKYRLLANKTGEKSLWDSEKLELELDKVDFGDFDFGFDEDLIKELEGEAENPYSTNVKIPHYDVTDAKPSTEELVNMDKVRELMVKIDASSLPDKEKEFLRTAAYRHAVFNYKSIAEFYANADVETQELMEDSALVIIDIDDAIAKGYAKLEAEIEDMADE